MKAQQRLIAGMLRTSASGPEATGLDPALWLDLQHACGLDAAALKHWHTEFERRSPAAHHAFLVSLGLSEKEAVQVRMLTRNIEDNTMSMHYFFELFESLPRQGPGCEEATLEALHLLKHLPAHPTVLDIGCGNGLQTLTLARELKSTILAIDNHPPLLRHLDQAAREAGLSVETQEMSMIDIPFAAEYFDLLWAEGSIFIIGLARGLQDFHKFLKPGGYLAFTEMCWFEADPPAEIRTYLDRVYPDIRSIETVCELAEARGYTVVDNFKLPASAWWDDFYTPMLAQMQMLKQKNAGISEAEAVYAACEEEITMYRRHLASYGYGFFVLQKR
ncbi:methyltransferase domain-containing protein [Accumulibacter sp.]|uniref:MerR family transcriptional regulator n=1 Tax=Accumulibacter sp. TaxID=2053492 RepID=UPI0025B8B675|nr:methyltransferase domain-containing protein [Accumulibacter sp.]